MCIHSLIHLLSDHLFAKCCMPGTPSVNEEPAIEKPVRSEYFCRCEPRNSSHTSAECLIVKINISRILCNHVNVFVLCK